MRHNNFAYNRKENVHTNQYLIFLLNKCARNVKMLCCETGLTLYVNIDSKTMRYGGLVDLQFQDLYELANFASCRVDPASSRPLHVKRYEDSVLMCFHSFLGIR